MRTLLLLLCHAVVTCKPHFGFVLLKDRGLPWKGWCLHDSICCSKSRLYWIILLQMCKIPMIHDALFHIFNHNTDFCCPVSTILKCVADVLIIYRFCIDLRKLFLFGKRSIVIICISSRVCFCPFLCGLTYHSNVYLKASLHMDLLTVYERCLLCIIIPYQLSSVWNRREIWPLV